MKKLMIAAAVAAMTAGAFAEGACERGDTPTTYKAMVYNLKMNVKTTKGVAADGKDIPGASNCERATPGACFVYRTKDTTTFQGFLFVCEPLCAFDTYSCVLVDTKRKSPATSASFSWDFVNVIGKKSTDAEAAATLAATISYDATRAQEYAIRLAGYGKFSAKKGYYTSFSGNFAGTATASYDLKSTVSKYECACTPSQVLKCDDLTAYADADTVAFGTWTLKYNATASKKYVDATWKPVIAGFDFSDVVYSK